jgi:hypothetical protein
MGARTACLPFAVWSTALHFATQLLPMIHHKTPNPFKRLTRFGNKSGIGLDYMPQLRPNLQLNWDAGSAGAFSQADGVAQKHLLVAYMNA